MSRRLLVGVGVCAAWSARPAGVRAAGKLPAASQPAAAAIEFFEKRIRPVLVNNCYQCHSAESARLRGDFRVDSLAGMLKGGGSMTPAVVPRQPEKSLLIKAISYTDEDLRMPPKSRLDEPVIADFVNWVNMGAPYPEDKKAAGKPEYKIDLEKGRQWWSFQPVRDSAPPSVKNAAWPRTPIDRFILARQEEKGLAAVARADKRTLIRRATFDLIGLPPAPEEVDAFLADESPDAFAKLVDRLLASPHYGERWGRHWLDLVRYADTAGDSSDYPVPDAYRYRNYVIDAFNQDKPYNRFLREQLAGDLLPARDDARKYEQIIATGFIAISRRFSVTPEAHQHLTIEDTIDALGKATLGLSVSCARCHDHKFDPIPTEDYYALYGFFSSTRYPFAGSENRRRPKDYVVLLPPDEAERQLRPLFDAEKKVAQLVAAEKEAEREKRQAPPKAEKDGQKAADKKNGEKSPTTRPTLAQIEVQTKIAVKERDKIMADLPPFPRAFAVAEGTPANARVQKRGEPNVPGDEVPRGFLQVLGGQKLPPEVKDSGRLQLADWIVDPKNPLTARVMVNRVWQYHFGKGIVQTPSDFGARGKAPTHPELLDYLARRFIESGWSIKAMHRAIMLSQCYQLAGSDDARNDAIDAANDYLWKFNRRRLSAEEIRDAMLAVSGDLDPSMAGPHLFPPAHTWDFTQHRAFSAVYDTNHRSVYVMQQRIKKHPFFALFDGADTNATTADRLISTTPVQALFLMNNVFVFQEGEHLAARLESSAPELRARIDRAHRLVFARTATADELNTAEAYILEYQEKLRTTTMPSGEYPRAALASYARVLLSSDEFMFVD